MAIELTQQNYKTEVLESNIPAVIKFYDHTCDVCKLLSPILEKVSKDYDGKANFANCNRLENSEIARKYGVIVASQIVVAYKDKKLGIFPGAMISSSGAHNAAKEEYLKQKINKCLEGIVK
jgi:thioredoxin-like negative regulator of GroEL